MRPRRMSKEQALRRNEKERQSGLDPDDEAARWLAENDAKPPPPESKGRFKSKELHRWRQRQGK